MRFAIVGAGAVGGFYGALLAKAGHDVSFVARGAHRDAINRDGLKILSGPEAVGEIVVRCPAHSDPAAIGPVDVVMNNVAVLDVGRVEDIPLAAWQRAVEVNLLSIVRSNLVFLPDLIAAIEQGGARVGLAVFVVEELAGMIRHQRDRFAHVERRAATDDDQRIGLVFLECDDTVLDLRLNGVPKDAAVKSGVHARLLQRGH